MSAPASAAPDQGRRDLVRLLVETGRPHLWRYAAAFALLAVVSATTAATAWLMKDIINEVFIAKSRSALVFVAVAVLVIYVARGLASYGQGVILNRIGAAIVSDGQERLVRRLLAEDVGVVLAGTSSETVQKIAMSADAQRQVLQVIVTGLGRDILSLVGLVGVMLVQDPWLSIGVLVVLPVAAVLLGGLGKRIRLAMKRHYGLTIGIADQLRQVVQGFRVVKAFGLEAAMERRLVGIIDDQRRNMNKVAILAARAQPIVETLAGIAMALVILYGGWRVIGHGATPGEFFSFITAMLLAYDPARRIAGAKLQIEQGLVGVRLFYEMMDRGGAGGASGGGDLADPRGAIRFEGVDFAYPDGTRVLRGLTLDFIPGETTALVGGSGSGKSTILALILRFFTPQAGRITIGGQDIAGLDAGRLRAAIAYVGQDAFLFDGTIRENIAAGREGADDAAIEAAARAAQAHDFILALPQGYETPVGELASRLSGGQRSRIAIARAFLRDAPILLLDEPTAALDAETEEAIRATLADLARGRTTILVAHRLASVRKAERIIVIENGQVAEQGEHDALVAAGGAYARLVAMQHGAG
ncbi:MAG: ABC transporter ATP-binding protein/permease [Hyphomicrobiales bacterium]|nr:ABC transporter ATP-binding protein/permease [Hyphomicrobiales bacterium]MCA2000065.1 ABC transporter ATP-binding protein/permease [Hyphomicrobiales bacterium]